MLSRDLKPGAHARETRHAVAAEEKRKPASTRDVILDLRERIASQALLPGTRVPEEDLAQAYDIPAPRRARCWPRWKTARLWNACRTRAPWWRWLTWKPRTVSTRCAKRWTARGAAGHRQCRARRLGSHAGLLGEPFEQSLKDGDIEAHVATIEQFRNRIKELARNPILSDMIERIYDRTRVSMRRVALLPGRSEMGISNTAPAGRDGARRRRRGRALRARAERQRARLSSATRTHHLTAWRRHARRQGRDAPTRSCSTGRRIRHAPPARPPPGATGCCACTVGASAGGASVAGTGCAVCPPWPGAMPCCASPSPAGSISVGAAARRLFIPILARDQLAQLGGQRSTCRWWPSRPRSAPWYRAW